jgi:hypothetical protein
MDIEQVMKYFDHDHQDFFNFYSSTGDNQQRGPGRIKYWAKMKVVVVNVN